MATETKRHEGMNLTRNCMQTTTLWQDFIFSHFMSSVSLVHEAKGSDPISFPESLVIFMLTHTPILTHLANGPRNKSLNFIFPTKYGIPQKFKRLAIGQVS